ncbi:putative pyridoxal-dependent aspartate 1-decarboxylase [Sesbania bispinosa]|nr:putative pyridoxal-dependent aspartate 1-decarboxylase [Sesbania bispinosa]
MHGDLEIKSFAARQNLAPKAPGGIMNKTKKKTRRTPKPSLSPGGIAMSGDLEIGTEASPATKACALGSISDPDLFDSDYCVPHRPEAPELVAEARVKAVGTERSELECGLSELMVTCCSILCDGWVCKRVKAETMILFSRQGTNINTQSYAHRIRVLFEIVYGHPRPGNRSLI